MTYTRIDNISKVLKRVGNIIYVATVFTWINDKWPSVLGFSNHTNKIDTIYDRKVLYTIETNDIETGKYSGRRYPLLRKRLSLVKGKPGNVVNIANYCGKT